MRKEGRYSEAKEVLDEEARAILGDAAEALESTDLAGATIDMSALGEETVLGIASSYRALGVELSHQAVYHALAEDCLQRARALGDKEALSKLDELAHIKNDWSARAAEFRNQGFEARDKRKAAEAYLRAAELYFQYGNDPIRSDEYLDRCLLLYPGFPAALRFLEAAQPQIGHVARS